MIYATNIGPMPLMANLLLSTRRPIINHPHYEDAGRQYTVLMIVLLILREKESKSNFLSSFVCLILILGLRERTKRVYEMYSRHTAAEYHKTLVDLKVHYLVAAKMWCFQQSRG